jgi:glyoxylase-like metal-dependent hydrolase (beta-lactamase superfamily II)
MKLAPASTIPPVWKPRSVEAGEWTITALSDGFMRLDGGSMWGVVPRALWSAMTPPAEDNTILIALRPFLATRGTDKVVIEVGIGARWEPKWRAIYQILATETLAGTLRALGVEPSQVTHVVASHCHWDHIGSQVVREEGELVPLFPNARHFAPAIELEMAKKPGHARAASYRAEDVLPIESRGLMTPYACTTEILPGLRAHVVGGHSDGVSVITFNEGADSDGAGGHGSAHDESRGDGADNGSSGGETAIFWSDVVPTAHHIQPPYIMAYDLDVVKSFEVRSQWLERAAREGWIGMFYHDVDHAFGRITRAGKRYAFEPI